MFKFFDWLIYFLTNTIPTILVDFFMWILDFLGFIVIKIINIIIEYVLPLINVDDFNESSLWEGMENAWNGLPSEALQIASYIQIPEAIAIITTSLMICFVKRKIPFMGR